MKLNIIRLIISAGLLLAYAGCTKERSDVVINNDNIETQINSGKFGPVAPATGVLVGKIVADTKYILILRNDEFKTDKFFIEPRTGYFVFTDIPKGKYTLFIYPMEPAYDQLEKPNVIIENGQITNLGIIKLN